MDRPSGVTRVPAGCPSRRFLARGSRLRVLARLGMLCLVATCGCSRGGTPDPTGTNQPDGTTPFGGATASASVGIRDSDPVESAFRAIAENAFSAMALPPVSFSLSGEESGLPGDVPAFPGAALQMLGLTEKDARFVSMQTARSPSSVYLYYHGALLASGWQIEEERQTGRRFVLVGRKRGRTLSVTVGPARSGSEIALETSTPTSPDVPSARVDREFEPLISEPKPVAGL